MEHYLIKENWLTRKAHPEAFTLTFVLSSFLFLAALGYLMNFMNADTWMAASGESVFQKREYWRLWTTLFAHGDIGHLLSNALLFIPLTYLLFGHYGFFLFPFMGLLSGGLINYLVLKTMPLQTHLIGISGLVYWMGAAWVTLFILIDRREKLRRRFAIALFLSLFLFTPESYKPEISYLSHFIGYVLGVISAVVLYLVRRKEFLAAEVLEPILDESEPDVFPHPVPEISKAASSLQDL